MQLDSKYKIDTLATTFVALGTTKQRGTFYTPARSKFLPSSFYQELVHASFVDAIHAGEFSECELNGACAGAPRTMTVKWAPCFQFCLLSRRKRNDLVQR
mmetsp:Transcript_4947/g.7329  ORF Transcript_4947/g.7329 Transcript_4947/m.7329 type:complete len:100 (+) Transcript_4947:552-851(+)